MYHRIVNMRLQAILECFVHDVIRSQNKSKLWTTIAVSKFELEKRSKAQNVANWNGYQKFKFQFHIQISKFWQVRNLRLPFHFLLDIMLAQRKSLVLKCYKWPHRVWNCCGLHIYWIMFGYRVNSSGFSFITIIKMPFLNNGWKVFLSAMMLGWQKKWYSLHKMSRQVTWFCPVYHLLCLQISLNPLQGIV